MPFYKPDKLPKLMVAPNGARKSKKDLFQAFKNEHKGNKNFSLKKYYLLLEEKLKTN